jgi:AhpD family alkylhydroperoxidase
MKVIRQLERPSLRKCTAVLFVLVMVGFGFVQAVHVHEALARQSAPASHCSMCVVAHSAAVLTAAGSAPVPAVESARLTVSDPQLRSQLRVVSSYILPLPQYL